MHAHRDLAVGLLAQAPQYWRYPPTSFRPWGNDTSSTAQAAGQDPAGTIRSAIRRRTGTGSQGVFHWFTKSS